MDTKKLLVFLAGAAVAYFVIKQMDKKTTTTTTPLITPPVIDPKLVACQAALEEALLTVRTTDIEGFKAQFMTDCMSAGPADTNAPIGENVLLQNELGL
jgi:hypothetical protein